MGEPSLLPRDFAWPIAVALAWVFGEIVHKWTRLPRISVYGVVGFVLGAPQLGMLPQTDGGPLMLLVNLAFGLILFEFGYRINVRWLRINPWMGATGVLASVAVFAAIYALASAFGMSMLSSLLLASLAMSTSPAALMRVVNEERSSGQVTERILHLAAISCVLSVFTFKVIVGFWTYQTSGNVWQAASNSLVVLAVSTAFGAAFGMATPALLRRFGRTTDATLVFAIGVMLLVAIAHGLKLSAVLASLTFGLVARHNRIVLAQTERNFGALGDLLGVLLFVFVATTIAWQRVWVGLILALLLIVVRLAATAIVVVGLARLSGVGWRKGLLTSLAMTPISVFVILVLEQTRYLGIDLVDKLAPLAALTLILELAGPVIAQRALQLAGEAGEREEA